MSGRRHNILGVIEKKKKVDVVCNLVFKSSETSPYAVIRSVNSHLKSISDNPFQVRGTVDRVHPEHNINVYFQNIKNSHSSGIA